MELVSAKPVPRSVRSSAENMKAIKTWNHQFESPKPKPEGYAPRYIQYKSQVRKISKGKSIPRVIQYISQIRNVTKRSKL